MTFFIAIHWEWEICGEENEKNKNDIESFQEHSLTTNGALSHPWNFICFAIK